MYYDGGFMGGMHGWWWLIGLLVISILLFASWGRTGRGSSTKTETPHQVLRRRLAGGEITSQEYEERKILLDRDTPGKG